MIFGAPPEHQYSAPSSSPLPVAMAAGGELPGGDTDGRSKPPKMTRMTCSTRSLYLLPMAAEPITPMLDLARSRTTPATVPCQQVNIDLHSSPLSSDDPTKNSQIWPSTPKPRTISLHPPSASSCPADQPVACQQPIDAHGQSPMTSCRPATVQIHTPRSRTATPSPTRFLSSSTPCQQLR
ncbi:hypothetical protein ACLOJK_037331 [Asimina triloba]